MSEQLSSRLTDFPYTSMHVTSPFTVVQQPPAWAGLSLQQLSPREREVLGFLAMRWTDREIAETLCISYRTVTTHVSNIFDKLGVNSRREAAAFVVRARNAAY